MDRGDTGTEAPCRIHAAYAAAGCSCTCTFGRNHHTRTAPAAQILVLIHFNTVTVLPFKIKCEYTEIYGSFVLVK